MNLVIKISFDVCVKKFLHLYLCMTRNFGFFNMKAKCKPYCPKNDCGSDLVISELF